MTDWEPSYLWEILIPTNWTRNESNPWFSGHPINDYHHQSWDAFVEEFSPGMTMLRPAEGRWVHPGTQQKFEELMIPVRLMCGREAMKKIAEFTIKHYQQKEVMYYRISDEVYFYGREDLVPDDQVQE